MAPTISQQRQIEELLKQYGPQIAKAFLSAMAKARSAVDQKAVIAALDAKNLEGAVQLLRIDQSTMFELHEAIRATFVGGGQLVGPTLPMAIRGSFSFNGRHLRAEAWMANEGAALIQGIEADSMEVTRRVITAGLQEGQSSATIARQITGTLNRITGRREGGALGLTTQQADSIISGRTKLASGDPALMREYLGLKQRNKLFDPQIRKAITEGRAITGSQLDKIITAHQSKALKYRGEMIARNEAFTAQAAGRDEAYRQLLDRNDVVDIEMRWQHNGALEPRLDHLAMNGTVISLRKGELFNFPDGISMKHPHDPAGGAKHIINCHCIAIGRVIQEKG